MAILTHASPDRRQSVGDLAGIGLLLLACSLLSCSTIEPRPPEAWEEPVHPLYATAVGIVTDDQYIGNGVIIHSSKARGTYILTLDHVIQPAPKRVRALIFKHSHLSAAPNIPAYQYIDATPLLREWRTTSAFAKALDDLLTLLDVIWGRDDIDYEIVVPDQHEAYQNLRSIVARLKHPTSEALFASYLEDFKTSVKQLHMSRREANQLSEAMATVMGIERSEALFDDLLARIQAWSDTSGQLLGQGGAIMEFAILQLKANSLPSTFHQAIGCTSEGVFRQPDLQLTYTSIYPKREPNTGQLVTQEGYRVAGKLKAGQSGSPVFYQQHLVGLIARKASRKTGYLMPLHTIQAALQRAGFEWMLAAASPPVGPCSHTTQVQAPAAPLMTQRPNRVPAQFWPGAQTSDPTSWSKPRRADTIN